MNKKLHIHPNNRQSEDDCGQQGGGRPGQSYENGLYQRHAAKGHAAYAAHDGEISPQMPEFGPADNLCMDNIPQPEGDVPLLSLVPRETLLAECQQRICPECPVKKEADDVRLRSLADLENTKKRLSREREEQTRFAAESVLADIIPSLDNLDLALQHAGGNEACRDFIIGVQMTRKLLLEGLQKHGLELTGKVGEVFDPAVHEAVGMANVAEVPDNHVCGLLSQGYKLKERLLRPARVMVCKKD